MRSQILSLVVLAAALLGEIRATSAQSPTSYPWCANFRSIGATSCYFTSYEQCMTTLSGIGGYCYESPYYHPSARPMRQRPFVAIGIHNGFAVSTIRTTCMLLRSVQFESDRSPDRSKL